MKSNTPASLARIAGISHSCLRRHRKELRALVPFDFGHVDHAEVDLVDQCRSL
jgi:hypothetical protein